MVYSKESESQGGGGSMKYFEGKKARWEAEQRENTTKGGR